ncbi:MAG: hypothetical protein SVR08_00185 [Spirochaetota bacterium]|nr:hypothetical protein [Spirochaetota bacterium]
MSNIAENIVFKSLENKEDETAINPLLEKHYEVISSANRRMLREVENLLEAIRAGRLDVRIDLNGICGENIKHLQYLNEMLDKGLGPLSVMAVCAEILSNI